ncbi:hypothetical protein GCM10009765_61780 [Fodinicola feengrottensis]|uniref:DUF6817 domain-containing protein n=2 Tax=Fodinicola feengrottensis TaxID=435914 RepID=A0ABN2IGE5_9ACTN
MEHPGGTLLAHLRRVSEELRGWGARPALQLAGLAHAFYGTDGFAESLLPLERREQLRTLTGIEAEALVYFYASCDRAATYPTLSAEKVLFRDRFTGETYQPPADRLRDFAELSAANELDIAQVSPAFRVEHEEALRRFFGRLRPWLSPLAWQACESLDLA